MVDTLNESKWSGKTTRDIINVPFDLDELFEGGGEPRASPVEIAEFRKELFMKALEEMEDVEQAEAAEILREYGMDNFLDEFEENIL